MLPRVIVHVAVSVDGRQDWIQPDLGLFYSLAAGFEEDVTLAGSATIVAGAAAQGWEDEVPETQEGTDMAPEGLLASDPDEVSPLLVVPDSRGRIRCWNALRGAGYWRGVLALTSLATPPEYLAYLDAMTVPHLACGADRVDLRVALEKLADDFGARVVRVDSGGALNGALLRAGLVSEVSVLIDPILVGGISSRSMFQAEDLVSSDGVVQLDLVDVRRVGQGGVWLRYAVLRPLVS
jgi:2,5-diamino-6-(ribosylamino)-4(3H)-pyrimidinone 5'-phosphate reductase